MRNMSFSLTTEQFKNKSKDVTRRIGWWFLKPGDELCAVEKAQGLKKGEKVKRMGIIRVISTRAETIYDLLDNQEYGKVEVIREGFPDMTPDEFVDFFIKSHSFDYTEEKINRIEFEYVHKLGVSAH